MNALVLVVAGIFVLTGVTLIVLSIVLFRGRKDADSEEVVSPQPDESSPVEPERAFIDEPLQRDFSLELGPAVTAAALADANTSPDANAPGQHVGSETAPTDASAKAELDESEDITAENPTPTLANAEVGAQPDVRQLSYTFRVHVAADHVRHGRLREAIPEFEKALTLTDDDEMRSQILAEVGNAWRDLGESETAAAAYTAAAERTADEGLRAQLQRSAIEMRRGDGSAPVGEVPGERPGS